MDREIIVDRGPLGDGPRITVHGSRSTVNARQRDHDLRAPLRIGSGRDAALMGFDDSPANRQAQSGAADLGGEKGFKEFLACLGSQTRAVVGQR